jgi:hypothetical protein
MTVATLLKLTNVQANPKSGKRNAMLYTENILRAV